jgi:hypothetical protein
MFPSIHAPILSAPFVRDCGADGHDNTREPAQRGLAQNAPVFALRLPRRDRHRRRPAHRADPLSAGQPRADLRTA